MSGPVCVLYLNDVCTHCKNLPESWYTKLEGETCIAEAMRKVCPNLRFFSVKCESMSGEFDENVVPKGLKDYANWFPMILLVPGDVWDQAMSKLGPDNNVSLQLPSVAILNGRWVNGKLHFEKKYERDREGLVSWLRSTDFAVKPPRTTVIKF